MFIVLNVFLLIMMACMTALIVTVTWMVIRYLLKSWKDL